MTPCSCHHIRTPDTLFVTTFVTFDTTICHHICHHNLSPHLYAGYIICHHMYTGYIIYHICMLDTSFVIFICRYIICHICTLDASFVTTCVCWIHHLSSNVYTGYTMCHQMCLLDTSLSPPLNAKYIIYIYIYDVFSI